MSEDVVEPDAAQDEGSKTKDLTEVKAQLTVLNAQLQEIQFQVGPQDAEEEEEEEEEEEPAKIAMFLAFLRALVAPTVILAALFSAGVLTYEARELRARVQEQVHVSQAQWRATRKSDLIDTLYRRTDCRLGSGDASSTCPVKASIRARAEAAVEYHQLLVDASNAQAPVDYSKVDLRGAGLLVANLQRVNFHDAMLQGANLGLANLMHANLQGAKMLKVDLQGAKLQHANFQDADLKQANLQDANLKDANLQGTNLQGANLDGVLGMTKSQIYGACIDAKTQLPKGLRKAKTNPAACGPWSKLVTAPSP